MITIKEGLQAIFWDFDGVLMDSNPVRNNGFASVLKDYPAGEVAQLLQYHKANGGLSRYVKFRYFFETIRNESITDEVVLEWATKFSSIMKENLLNKDLLISETLSWVKANYLAVPMHIVSGSDGQELRFLCHYHGIDHYFKDIEGSPTPKKQLVDALLKKYSYTPGNCVLVGDSINDYEAAQVNGLQFFHYNNPALEAMNNYL
jgi:phosphoglycolate phosphatase-like HAD superfamily hydrolase